MACPERALDEFHSAFPGEVFERGAFGCMERTADEEIDVAVVILLMLVG
jgi:hypothetical protein